MNCLTAQKITDVIGAIPGRMAFAGGWIDQPFVSKHNPKPPGSMVVVGLEPTFLFMERAGMGTGTRKVAMRLWEGELPKGDPMDLVKELYAEENRGSSEPSGSQDMIGLIYPGINRLDFDYEHEGGLFPCHIESNNNPDVAEWLEEVVHMVPIAPRPPGYNPLGEKNLEPECIRQLGQTGKDCYDAILAKDVQALGRSMNECMECWEKIMPHIVRHSTLGLDLLKILSYYQSQYPGAMYSGCGGGYLYVVSEEPVPGGISVQVRCSGRKE
ncbi:MAG: hypothetical protein ABGX16_06985 [Pirellulales bacterium]